MSESELKLKVQGDMKQAMLARDKERLQTIRLIMAAIKQWEVDQREQVSDDMVVQLLAKMAKQRRESIQQYQKAERADLEEQEQKELKIIESYLPAAMPEEEILALISKAISSLNAQSIRDMGKVMAEIKPQLQGRADMSKVSALIKQKLA